LPEAQEVKLPIVHAREVGELKLDQIWLGSNRFAVLVMQTENPDKVEVRIVHSFDPKIGHVYKCGCPDSRVIRGKADEAVKQAIKWFTEPEVLITGDEIYNITANHRHSSDYLEIIKNVLKVDYSMTYDGHGDRRKWQCTTFSVERIFFVQ